MFRLLRLFVWLLALLVAGSCAEREKKQIGESKRGDNSSDTNQNKDTPSGFGESANADASSAAGNNEVYPEGLSKTEYEEGERYVGNWDGLADEADPTGKWALQAKPNPSTLSGAADAGASGAPAVSLAEVRPIIQNACVSCHSAAGSRATSPMETDEQIMQHFDGIKSRVQSGSMPPAGPLAQDQKNLIAQWSKEAAPPTGDPQTQPTQQQAPTGGVQ